MRPRVGQLGQMGQEKKIDVRAGLLHLSRKTLADEEARQGSVAEQFFAVLVIPCSYIFF